MIEIVILIAFIATLIFVSDIYEKSINKNKPIIRQNFCNKCLETIKKESESEQYWDR